MRASRGAPFVLRTTVASRLSDARMPGTSVAALPPMDGLRVGILGSSRAPRRHPLASMKLASPRRVAGADAAFEQGSQLSLLRTRQLAKHGGFGDRCDQPVT